MLPQRNPDGKGCSLAGIAGYADFSSVHLGNLSGNRQAKPKAATGTAGGCAIEAVKNMGQRCRRNGCAGVVYAQLKPLLLLRRETVTFFSSPAYLMALSSRSIIIRRMCMLLQGSRYWRAQSTGRFRLWRGSTGNWDCWSGCSRSSAFRQSRLFNEHSARASPMRQGCSFFRSLDRVAKGSSESSEGAGMGSASDGVASLHGRAVGLGGK